MSAQISSDLKVTPNDLIVVARSPSFQVAAQLARELAIETGTTISVRRQDAGWVVTASSAVKAVIGAWLVGEADDEIDDFEDPEENTEDDTDDHYDDELREELRQEFEDNVESWARSGAEGWYYED